MLDGLLGKSTSAGLLGDVDNPFVNAIRNVSPMLLQAGMGMNANPQNPWGGAVNAMALSQAEKQKLVREQAAKAKQDNATLQVLVNSGKVSPEQAQAIVQSGMADKIVPQLLMDSFKTPEPSAKYKEYQDFVEAGGTQTYPEYLQSAGGGGGQEYGLNPVYGTDENGNTVIMQLSKSGQMIKTPIPEGVQITAGTRPLDAGTAFIIQDVKSGKNVGVVEKDVAGEAREQVTGKAQAERALAAPAEIATAERTLQGIEELKKDPGLKAATGATGRLFRNIPGSAAFAASQRVEQLKGQAFLEAYKTLKGGGPITDIEGRKAEQALNRMTLDLSYDDFMQALQDFEDAVRDGMQKLQAAQGGGASDGLPPPPTLGGSIKTKYGLE